MSQNFNVDPYYDDFDQTKNFHRILFKPGVAVQARELTQSQTILQDQITKFADNIFKQNSPVTGGQVTTNFDCQYVKLKTTYNNTAIDVTKFDGLLVQSATGEVMARVLKAIPATGTDEAGDPPTLVLSYKTGTHFTNGDVIYDVKSNLAVQAIGQNATGASSVASISQGVFYVLGNFVQIQPSTVVLNKYSNSPNARVGLDITETVVDYINDSSLLDPAVGASNYQAPGADRYQIALTLSTRTLDLGDDQNFIELVRITEGAVAKMVDGSVYNVIDDYFAKRDYETNGDYVVEDFKLTPKTNADESMFDINVGKGLAYVHGYRLENQAAITLTADRARTTASQNASPIFVDVGSYFYVDRIKGNNASFFDTTTLQVVDLHCVDSANVNFTTSSGYKSTVVATGFMRGLVYDHANGSYANTYVYKAFVHDMKTISLTDTVESATSNTVVLPTTFNAADGAYVGATISIANDITVTDFRTITAYDGYSKTATVNQPWTVIPTSGVTKFTLNFELKDAECITAPVDRTTSPVISHGQMRLEYESRSNGLATGYPILQNPTVPEMLFRVGSPFVSSIGAVSYTTQQVWRNKTLSSTGGSVSVELSYEGDYLDVIKHFGTGNSTLTSDVVKQNFTVIVTDKKTNTTINNGDILNWTTTGRTIVLDNDGSIATLSATDLSPFTATIVSKVFVQNGLNTGHVLKYKNLIVGNTTAFHTGTTQIDGDVVGYTYVDDAALTSSGQVYITYNNFVAPGEKQSLFLSDVKNVKKIIDTKTDTSPTAEMFTNPAYDVTNRYTFDNGQRDGYYDHASITLRPGAEVPKGNILVIVDYYQHAQGDGYFSLSSYLNSSLQEDYREIPSYTSTNGTTYQLRDCLDFRPARLNAQKDLVYRLSASGADNRGVILPVDLTTISTNYSYYLGRKDKLILSKDKSFEIIQGAPSLTPLSPSQPDGSLLLANLTHQPYTGYIPTEVPTGRISDLSIEKVKHKRYTMQDIAGIEGRINQIEYYTSLSLLEQKAQSLQISDGYGLNRFKNGILVDDFSGYGTAGTNNTDYFATINRRDRKLTAPQTVKNFPLKSVATLKNMGNLDNNTSAALGYDISIDGSISFTTLPYTTANAISQKFASRTVNVNPFSVSLRQGTMFLSPNMDNWVDTNYAPALLITDPNLNIFQSNGGKLNTMTVGDWKTLPGTTHTGTSTYTIGHGINPSPYGYVGYETHPVLASQTQNNLVGKYDKIDNTYSVNNGYVTDISVLPYTRAQQVVVRSRGMLFNTPVTPYFDGVDVTKYVRKSNVMELTGVTGTFTEGDTIGMYSGGSFAPTGRVVGVYAYPNTNNVRLYVAADPTTTAYTTNGIIQNGFFDTAGIYRSTTASGTLSSTNHFGGRLVSVASTTKVQLSSLASSTNEYYTGNTIYICAGTGVGQSATITKYFGANTTAILSTGITCSATDIYSIGTHKTDETGSLYAIFNLPGNTFHTGQRVLRIDNSINGNKDSATTFAESTFYSEGLQTSAQKLDFGASPAGAKDVFAQSNYKDNVLIGSYTSPWDPVAQTFIVDKANYPNGMFLNSVKFFFQSKPLSDNSTVTLSIVGTQNGYPNGETLSHSIVTLTPKDVKTNATPQYLDPNSYTEFTFSAPVYIQPGTLYAFILKTASSDYKVWTASNGDTALASSTKNLPTDPIPSTITKIGTAPYVGALFVSQNAQTWTADQNQSLMFVVDRCVFNTSSPAQLEYVVPKRLPQRTLVDSSLDYYLNANNVSSSEAAVLSSTDSEVHAFNLTTTDFTPTGTGISYSYKSTLKNGSSAGVQSVVPGKYGTPTQDDIYLNDQKGVRILQANTSTSFSLYASASTTDDAVSPVVSDAGLSLYTVEWSINNCELSNTDITVVTQGANYDAANTTVTISAPTGKNGTQAYGVANVVNGKVDRVYITNGGSGYIETPTIVIGAINQPLLDPAAGATAVAAGETNKSGGNAVTRYLTKKVVLDAGFDSGDLNVFLTAYRPVGTDIHVYYKILNRNDTQKFEDSSWQLMTKTKSCDTTYATTRDDVYEYTFAPGTGGFEQGFVNYTSSTGETYNSFSQFAIKVVLTTSDKTNIPYVSDLRAIALPSNTVTV